jgi:UDP-N-acetylmuramoylalanine--D-glutamate ligase
MPEFDGQIRIEQRKDVPDCVLRAREIAEPGDVVFFSPASASFDAYPNFEVRGKHFKSLVMELK